jgi:hypothetical protein
VRALHILLIARVHGSLPSTLYQKPFWLVQVVEKRGGVAKSVIGSLAFCGSICESTDKSHRMTLTGVIPVGGLRCTWKQPSKRVVFTGFVGCLRSFPFIETARCTARRPWSEVFQNSRGEKGELASSFEYVIQICADILPAHTQCCAIPNLCLLLRIGVGDTGGVNLLGTVQWFCGVVR